MAELAASSSYWEVGDYGQVTRVLRAHGVAIRLLKRGKDCQVYDLNGLEMHVYRRLRPLGRYRISSDGCARVVNSWKDRKRALWLVVYADIPFQPIVNDTLAAFTHNGHIHVVSYDTSVAGFVKLVLLVSRILHMEKQGLNHLEAPS